MENLVLDSLRNFVENGTSKCKILVVGDLMLDLYYFGQVSRISPEAPVPINHVLSIKKTLGGAANVAHNLALLGANTSIAGFIGDDIHGQTLIDKLISRNIDHFNLVSTTRPTTTKIRIIGGHQQMLRLDFEDSSPFDPSDSSALLQNISNIVNALDAVIISDYAKGLCTEEFCQNVIKLCRQNNVKILVDPKGSDWSKYSGANYITPNLKELNAVLDCPIPNQDIDVENAAQLVCEKFNIDNIIVTRSDKGLTILTDDKSSHIRAKAQEVFDVSGAGDTVIAVFTLALTGGFDPHAAAYLANLAASIVVAKVGTYAVSRDELNAALSVLNN